MPGMYQPSTLRRNIYMHVSLLQLIGSVPYFLCRFARSRMLRPRSRRAVFFGCCVFSRVSLWPGHYNHCLFWNTLCNPASSGAPSGKVNMPVLPVFCTSIMGTSIFVPVLWVPVFLYQYLFARVPTLCTSGCSQHTDFLTLVVGTFRFLGLYRLLSFDGRWTFIFSQLNKTSSDSVTPRPNESLWWVSISSNVYR